MLSRIAESLFWIGRLVERAEDTARLLDVSLSLLFEDAAASEPELCAQVLATVGLTLDADVETSTQHLLDTIAYDPEGPVCGSMSAARESARTVREVISSEMWEVLNTTHNALPAQSARARRLGPGEFFTFIKQRAALVSGLADSTMSTDDGWYFLVLGRSLERVDMTLRMLSISGAGLDAEASSVALLRCCGAYEAYLRTYRGAVASSQATAFLLLDRLFPRSVFAALSTAERCLARLSPAAPGRTGTADPGQLALGRARTNLEFADPREIAAELPVLLRDLQEATEQTSQAVTERFFRHAASVHWVVDVGS